MFPSPAAMLAAAPPPRTLSSAMALTGEGPDEAEASAFLSAVEAPEDEGGSPEADGQTSGPPAGDLSGAGAFAMVIPAFPEADLSPLRVDGLPPLDLTPAAPPPTTAAEPVPALPAEAGSARQAAAVLPVAEDGDRAAHGVLLPQMLALPVRPFSAGPVREGGSQERSAEVPAAEGLALATEPAVEALPPPDVTTQDAAPDGAPEVPWQRFARTGNAPAPVAPPQAASGPVEPAPSPQPTAAPQEGKAHTDELRGSERDPPGPLHRPLPPRSPRADPAPPAPPSGLSRENPAPRGSRTEVHPSGPATPPAPEPVAFRPAALPHGTGEHRIPRPEPAVSTLVAPPPDAAEVVGVSQFPVSHGQQPLLDIHAPQLPAPAAPVAVAALAPMAVAIASDPGSGEIAIDLSPAELGRVRMRVNCEGDALSVVILADRPETLDLLRRNGAALASEFADAGFSQASLEFGQGGTSAFRGEADPGEQAAGNGPGAEDGAAPPIWRSRQPASLGQLDLRL